MLSGRRLDLLDPSPLDVELDDIAHGLARVARWNGQTEGGHVFSVAQHSLLVEAIAAAMEPDLPRTARLSLVLHDAPEYVIGDIITPLKAVIGDGYVAVEGRLLRAIRLRFGLPAEPGPDLARLVKRADRAAARLEAVRLAGFSAEEADSAFGPAEPLFADLGELVWPWPTEQASARYRDRVAALIE
jgi:5'-deoxynucleotidase YfbR-like HD superfamily hydrolase